MLGLLAFLLYLAIPTTLLVVAITLRHRSDARLLDMTPAEYRAHRRQLRAEARARADARRRRQLQCPICQRGGTPGGYHPCGPPLTEAEQAAFEERLKDVFRPNPGISETSGARG